MADVKSSTVEVLTHGTPADVASSTVEVLTYGAPADVFASSIEVLTTDLQTVAPGYYAMFGGELVPLTHPWSSD